MDKLESETHNALLHHVSRSFSQASQESADNMEMELNPVPADGNCFFHSVLGALNYHRYKATQRKDTGYAIERHHVQAEEVLASKLRSSILDGDCQDAEWQKVAEMLNDPWGDAAWGDAGPPKRQRASKATVKEPV